MLRVLEYYLDGTSENYWSYLEREFPNIADIQPRSALTMHATAHHLWTLWLLAFAAGPWPSAEQESKSLTTMTLVHARAMAAPSYGDLVKRLETTGKLAHIDRGLLNATKAMVATAPAWRSGAVRLGIAQSEIGSLSRLLLPQDEFPPLRDAYQQTFEAVCKSLSLLVASLNAEQNGDVSDFTGRSYTDTNGTTKSVNTLASYERLSNANKLAVIRADSRLAAMLDALDNRTRNAIGHASAHHDLRSGLVINDKGDQESYFDFVAKVYRLTVPLMAAVGVVRGCRVYAAELLAE
ncbi:hypothetical protein ACNTMW_30370 [Planosporangium sp. 12N6]|uniref:hypothetical protein n=1 Tax=Planosporangium spinosum TaxID=3402278 RepID=UPI003CF28741